ncbi:MAG: endonuclease/exonuclease/phosphatase family protein [Prevotellaceae bacterium]|jgi:endonuclease/exonuclease/phosphatase family metal-dependent hydrolase|nr:endonuclease/exonuclease/phosphatase family protein [Prevotellaceae bacterium]
MSRAYFTVVWLLASLWAQGQGVSTAPDRLAFAQSVPAGGASAAQRFTATAAGLSGVVSIAPSAMVQASLTGLGDFSSSPLTVDAASLSGGLSVYVRFAPGCSGFADSAVSGSVILLDAQRRRLGSVAVAGVVRQEGSGGGTPFKVATFNAEWLGCPTYGPEDEALQMRNVAEVIRGVNADVMALQEVTDNPTKATDTLLMLLGSAWGGYVKTYSNGSCAQSEAIVYRKSRVALNGTPRLMNDAGSATAWSSGRFPVEFDLTVDGKTPLTLINLHAKAYSDAESYARRVAAAQGLKTLLDGSSYSAKPIIVAGDYNDRATGSTCSSCGESPYKNFVDDTARYRFLTQQYSSSIDHLMISAALFSLYVEGSTARETAVTGAIPSYSATTSDHTPISAIFAFGKAPQSLPVAERYTVFAGEGSLALPPLSAAGQAVSYAVDSGVALSLGGATATVLDTGTVRMVAWLAGTTSLQPAAMFFYVQVAGSHVAPSIAAQPAAQAVALDAPALFTVQASGTALRYQWQKDGKDIGGATSFQYAIGKANNPHIGYYACTVSNEVGSATSQAAALCVGGMCPAATAVGKGTHSAALLLYPNPIHGGLLRVGGGPLRRVRRVALCSLAGVVLRSYALSGSADATIDVSALPRGVYVVSVALDNGEQASRIVVKP